jgi:hypothetical protein
MATRGIFGVTYSFSLKLWDLINNTNHYMVCVGNVGFYASSGNRTRAASLEGKNDTTSPWMRMRILLSRQKACPPWMLGVLIYPKPDQEVGRGFLQTPKAFFASI